MDLQGRIAVITGAAQGIGREYALGLAEDGATVVAADVNLDGAQETAKLAKERNLSVVAKQVDVSDRESTLALAEEVRGELGNTNILVNNAAIYHSMRMDPVLQVDIEYWRKMFSVNVDGALLMSQAFAPQLIEAGWGRIINQSSTAAYLGGSTYGATKLALINLTKALATELGGYGITCNAIAPGPVRTEATAVTVPKERIEGLVQTGAIKRAAEPQEFVGLLRFLCSDAAGWMTAETLVMDGGQTHRI